MNRRTFITAATAPLVALFWSLPLSRLLSREVTWTGAVSGDTRDPRNWRHGRLPFDGCDLIVNGGGYALLLESSLIVNSLTIVPSSAVGWKPPATFDLATK